MPKRKSRRFMDFMMGDYIPGLPYVANKTFASSAGDYAKGSDRRESRIGRRFLRITLDYTEKHGFIVVNEIHASLWSLGAMRENRTRISSLSDVSRWRL